MSGMKIVGCGTLGNGDDQVGLEIARRIQALRPDWPVSLDTGGGTHALRWAEGTDLLILIDACLADAATGPGQMRRIDYTQEPAVLDRIPFASTHSMSVATGLKLLIALERLPRRVYVYAVGTSHFTPCESPSPVVRDAIETCAARVVHDVRALMDTTECTS